MKCIEPRQFSREFLSVAVREQHKLAELWWEYPRYTQYFITELLPKVAKRLGLNSYSSDYYTLDSIFYTSKDVENFKEPLIYANYVAVAIECENKLRGSACEMNKLQLFNTPLTVLFVYANRSDHREEYLRKYANIVRTGDWSANAGITRQHLVIFGEKLGELQSWRSHAYKDGEFALIAS